MGERYAVGIDLGTATTLVADRHGRLPAATIPIGRATPWMPSVVAVNGSGMRVGEEAEAAPRGAVLRSAKSAITCDLPALMTPGGESVSPEGAMFAILAEAVGRARAAAVDLDENTAVHLGCPAMWQAPERKLLVDTAQECGLGVDLTNIIDEPVAAGVAWIEARAFAGERLPNSKVLVFDSGGGTLDVAVLQTRSGPSGIPEITVLSAESLPEAGDALDESIAGELATQLGDAELKDLDPVVRALLSDRARDLKEQLSESLSARVALGGGRSEALTYHRTQLEEAFSAQCRRARGLVDSVVRAALLRDQQTLTTSSIRGSSWEEAADGIHFVLMVGGLSRVPMIRRMLEEFLPRASVVAVADPQEAVVRGLAFAEQFERLNLHRPAFNFAVSWYGPGKRLLSTETLYRAFTPLYRSWEVVRQVASIGYTPSGDTLAPRGAVEALVHCTTVDGQKLSLVLDGEEFQGIPVQTSSGSRLVFKLYANGDIVVGPEWGTVRLRVRTWPTLRGGHHNWTMEVSHVGGERRVPLLMDEWRFVH